MPLQRPSPPQGKDETCLDTSKIISPLLSVKVCEAIISDFRRVMAQDAINMVGKDVFSSDMTDEEFNSMSDEELVDRLVSETDYSEEDDYVIVDIELINE